MLTELGIPDAIPMGAAIGLGLLGLAAGAVYAKLADRDILRAARRARAAAAVMDVRAEQALARVTAIQSPTQPMDLTGLRAATATPVERLGAAVTDLAERVREAVSPAPGPRDWVPGEMTEAFNRIVDSNEWELPTPTQVALVGDLPPAPAVVHPLRPTAPPPVRPQAPPLVRGSGQPQPAPRWQDLPAPADRPRSRGAMALAKLRARGRDWGTILDQLPVMDPPPFPEPFRTPGQRLPDDPRRLAMLAADPTRRWRTKVAA